MLTLQSCVLLIWAVGVHSVVYIDLRHPDQHHQQPINQNGHMGLTQQGGHIEQSSDKDMHQLQGQVEEIQRKVTEIEVSTAASVPAREQPSIVRSNVVDPTSHLSERHWSVSAQGDVVKMEPSPSAASVIDMGAQQTGGTLAAQAPVNSQPPRYQQPVGNANPSPQRAGYGTPNAPLAGSGPAPPRSAGTSETPAPPGACVTPLWTKAAHVCVEGSKAKEFAGFNGKMHQMAEDGDACTVQCPEKYWMTPSVEKMNCENGKWETHDGKAIEGIACKTALWVYGFGVLSIIGLAFAGKTYQDKTKAEAASREPGAALDTDDKNQKQAEPNQVGGSL